MLDVILDKISAEPIRTLTWTLSAAVAVLAFAGVTDGPWYENLSAIVLLLGGGEKARSKVTPV